MRRRFWLPVFVMAWVAIVEVESALAAEKTIRLKDHINHEWSNELVTYSLTFEPGTCHASSIALLGPDGPVPFQLSEVKKDKQRFVTSGRLSFISDSLARRS